MWVGTFLNEFYGLVGPTKMNFKLQIRSATMLAVTLFALPLLHTTAQAVDIAGQAVSVVQSATLSNAEGRVTMADGTEVAMGDQIKTNRNGRVELIFSDETKLVVGPNSAMVIESYLLRSDNKANSFTVRALGGSFRFITGKSEKTAYKIKTPTATIGIRGTSFDMSVTRRGNTDLILFSGAAEMCNNISCVTVERQCGLARAPRLEPTRVIRDDKFRDARIYTHFPYILSQEQLDPRFHVAETGCGDGSTAAFAPAVKSRSRRANDDDPDSTGRRDPPSRSRDRNDDQNESSGGATRG